MKVLFLIIPLAFLSLISAAQKKPLDHTVYDGWQNISERLLSPDGKYLVYTVTPQEGDAKLVISSIDNTYKKEIPRGANASITEDSRFLVFLIKPLFKDTRDAKIKKKTPDQMPKDTLALIELGKDSLVKIPRVKSYKVPEKQGGLLAYLLEKPLPQPAKPESSLDSLSRIKLLTARADSLARVADSLRTQVTDIRTKGFPKADTTKKKPRPAPETVEEGTELVVRDLNQGREKKFAMVSEYTFSKNGKVLVVETTRKNSDTLSKALVLWVSTTDYKTDTVMKGFNDAKNYAIDEEGKQLAFIAERDSATKGLVKFYRLWYYTPGADSACIRVDRNTLLSAGSSAGIVTKNFTVSTDYNNRFSKDGSRLFLGLAPIRPPKDTTLVDFETARLDVWNYKDDYLAPQQLVQLNNELKRSYLAELNLDKDRFIPLGDENCETIITGEEGNGNYALGQSTKGYRIQQQWEQDGLQKIYLIDLRDGSRKLVKDKIRGGGSLSPGGKFILWYDWQKKHWFAYETASGRVANITEKIRVPLFDEEDDHPDDPPPHGSMGWKENDEYVYIYDRYDIWQCDPAGKTDPVNLTRGLGRSGQNEFRYISLDREERFLRQGQTGLLTVFNHKDKSQGLKLFRVGEPFAMDPAEKETFPCSFRGVLKAKNNWTLAFLQGSFDKPYDIYVMDHIDTSLAGKRGLMQGGNGQAARQLSHINPQQQLYNWYTVELCHWRMFDGKMSEGLLYKPENFDSTKKYPVIFYFYERNADTRYLYSSPAPTPSIINIPYYVSNGYIVFDPNIYYKTGQPGEDAYNSVISAAKYLSKFKWVDTTRLGLEGHSWGGYQVSYLVTRTHIFAAAEAGAPVANMTSAYGGIRWGTGISRQFQYEKSQSRIGSTLWEHPELFIKNSPLFRADKITTPLLILHNDADGAVPWYQGIEFFSALKRLGKKTWLLQYNGEDHGLQERRNRKDWTIRMSQFFAYYLKGEPAPKWMTEGVPATLKGIDWGLGQ